MLSTLRTIAAYLLGIPDGSAEADDRPPKQPREPCFMCGKPTRRRLIFHEPDGKDGFEGAVIAEWPACKRDVRMLLAKTRLETMAHA